ncbi:conserved hypothetical protein [Neospora caninum Liverpool]|uniref:SRS domain-containing protein n=1 Tax=Neospora caninum (strain Liverpool) TaxID=572307 RepID=F0VC35_NEOCL|nr:conserved hypothetical protein [Neospora caninum Liverpool]CBZ51169.1 conserved hypothetical protein [Neospora caninum Liverpool]CEL68480.1 TPA: hypothetical protein BN1204_042360 [Neospora caninum Liverpool]|eukprot:XP_003881202.1 conserved hypothetical protein [Neospora caninum Liverpool]
MALTFRGRSRSYPGAALLLLVSLSTLASVSLTVPALLPQIPLAHGASENPVDSSSETVNSTTTTVTTALPSTAECSAPVHNRACTLDLVAGQTGKFTCAFPLPDSAFTKAYTTDGSVVSITEIVAGATTSKTGADASITIPTTFQSRACFAITCSAMDTTPVQTATGTPNRETALKMVRYTLLVRVNKGTAECADEPALLPSSQSK